MPAAVEPPGAAVVEPPGDADSGETADEPSRAERVKSVYSAGDVRAEPVSPFPMSAREILTRLRVERPPVETERDKRVVSGSATRVFRRALRKSVPYSVAELYMKLGTALSARGEFDRASEAFLCALEEGTEDLDVLADYAHAAERSGATDLALVANLERALRDPQRADKLAAHCIRFVDESAALAEGPWIIDEWYPRLCERLPPAERVESALLTVRVCLFRGQDDRALALLRDLAHDVPSSTDEAGRDLLESGRLPQRLLRDDLPAHAVRAQAYAALGAVDKALAEIAAALGATVRDADPLSEIPLHELKADLLERQNPQAAGQALVAAGRLFNLCKRHDDAIVLFERATRVDPRNAVAFWYLADSRRLTAELPRWPYGDERKIEDAYADWRAGMAIAQPTPKHAWVHLSGALILETLARGSNPDGRLLWQAALETERAVALDPSASEAWAVASAYHRLLLHPATARVTADAACRRAPDGARAQIEHLIAYVDIMAPETPELLQRCKRKLPEHRGWTLAVEAYDALLRGDVDAARAACEASFGLADDESFTWPYMTAAIASALAGDLEDAERHADTVMRLTEPQRPGDAIGNRDDRGVAALILGRREEAAQIFSELLETYWVDCLRARAALACALLLHGDGAAAEREMTTFAGRAVQPAQIAFARLFVDLVARLDPEARACEACRRLLDDGAQRMRMRSFDVDDALEELSAVLAHGPSGDERSNVVWATRARILAEAGRLDEAAEAYEFLLANGDAGGGPAARAALVRVLRQRSASAAARHDVDAVRAAQHRLVTLCKRTELEASVEIAAAQLAAGLLKDALDELAHVPADAGAETQVQAAAYRLRGDALLAAGRSDDARAAYEEALRRSAQGPARDLDVAPLHIRLALLDARDENLASAGRGLRHAVTALRGDVEVQTAAHDVVAECLRLQEPAGPPPALDCALRALAEDPELSSAQRRHLTAARFAALRGGDAQPAAQPIWPLVVEAEAGALDAPTAQDRAQTFVDGIVPRLRERVLAATGVRLPGVLVRSSNVLMSGRYRILFNEIAYGSGEVGTHLCLDPDACARLGVDGTEVVHAWTGACAVRIAADDASKALDAGLELVGPTDALAWHLEGLVRLHLERFVGLSEVEYQLHEWELEGDEQRFELVRRALPGKRARVRLVVLMRRLVRGHVAVDDLGSILRGVVDAPSKSTLDEVVEVVRHRLGLSLPGVRDSRPRVDVPPELEREFDGAGSADERAAARTLLHLVAEQGLRGPGAFVLVTSTVGRRQLVERALQHRIASVAVVSASELEAAERAVPSRLVQVST